MSSPVDPEFEMLVLGCCINLLEGLKQSKFKGSQNMNFEMLQQSGISDRKRLLLLHKLGQSRILEGNIKLL